MPRASTQSAGTLNIGAAASQSGTLKVDGGAKLSGGALNINEGGLLSLTGTLSETAGDLNLNAGGAISGGVIDATGGAVNFNGGALNGVTFDGPLNLTASGASVHLVGGAKVVGSSGSGAGTINVTAPAVFPMRKRRFVDCQHVSGPESPRDASNRSMGLRPPSTCG